MKERPIYVFEEVDEDLSQLPTAAQRALDLAGEKLSPEAWRSLTVADRMALVTAGAFSTVDPELVRSIVAHAAPSPMEVEPRLDPDPDAPPPDLLRALSDTRALTQARWASLRPLDRYALTAAAAKGPEGRLQQAYDEILHSGLSHLKTSGEVHMVGVTDKPMTARRAVATASLRMKRETLERLWSGAVAKGDALATARVAAIQAAKRTWEIIPLCHPIKLTGIDVDIEADRQSDPQQGLVRVRATVDAFDRTGAEMEAMVAASTAALTLYDMLKGIDRWMTIDSVELIEKSGGRSGEQKREGTRP
jgi:cyclic pyranopterin phosphate synthase